MTPREIIKYIDEQIADIKKDKYIYNYSGDTVGEIKGFRKTEHALYEIKSMLDELEDRPKAKWVATERHLYMCTNCESEFIETSEHNYCPMCGARMNDELNENSK